MSVASLSMLLQHLHNRCRQQLRLRQVRAVTHIQLDNRRAQTLRSHLCIGGQHHLVLLENNKHARHTLVTDLRNRKVMDLLTLRHRTRRPDLTLPRR